MRSSEPPKNSAQLSSRTRPPLSTEDLKHACLRLQKERNSRHLRILELSREAERLMHQAAGLDAESEQYLDSEIGAHPAAYPSGRGPASSELEGLYTMSIDELIAHAVSVRGGLRALVALTYVADRRLEVLTHYFQCHPSLITAETERLGILPPGRYARFAEDILSYLVGVAFGRWDVGRVGEDDPDPGALPVDTPLPPRPPGMLQDVDSPFGGLAGLALPGCLVDEPGHPADIVDSVGRLAELVLPRPESVLQEILEAVGARSLRGYLRGEFFKRHLARYSRSKRKAPIYWLLQVPSRKWGVWLYAPRLSRETLYAVAAEALRRENLARSNLTLLKQERANGGAGRTAKALDADLAAETALLEELTFFRSEAERISEFGWEPERDDGAVLCAAPLAKLMPAWPDAEKYRREVVAGKYDWAHVSRWADQL